MTKKMVRAPKPFYVVGGVYYVYRVIDRKRVRLSTGCRTLEDAFTWLSNHPEFALSKREKSRVAAAAAVADSAALAFEISGAWLTQTLGRINARNRSRGFANMARADLVALIQRANGRCELTGLRFSAAPHPGALRRPLVPSVDRIDNAGPYSISNCRLVCLAVNVAMNQWGNRIFDLICQARSAEIARDRATKMPQLRQCSDNLAGSTTESIPATETVA